MGRCTKWIAVLSVLVACSTSTRRRELDAALDAGPDARVTDAASDARIDAGAPADAALDGNDDQPIRPDRMYVYLECPIRLAPANVPLRSGYNYPCLRSADCTEQPNGVCFADVRMGELYDSHCGYLRCVGDSDCATNEACECTWGWSGFRRCIAVECHTDSDCVPGQQCLSWPLCYDDVLGKSCTTADDLCRENQDCQDMGAGDICIDTGPRRTAAPPTARSDDLGPATVRRRWMAARLLM